MSPSTNGGRARSKDRESLYRQAACDELLAEENCESDDSERIRYDDEERDPVVEVLESQGVASREALIAAKRRARSLRAIALICTCSLSIGSHYANYILGPLKSRLQREIGASHAEFGLLMAAYTLNSTWTPLVGGILASRLGTTYTSILATGVIFLGQVILLIGDIWGDVRLMVLGLFVFGFGVSPLAVVQETIIVRFFKFHGLGLSMALGLVAGKGASFVAARTSYPLTERFGGRAPFYVATTLAGLSVIVNILYLVSSRWLVDGAGAELEAPDIKEEAHRRELIDMSEAQALQKVAKKRHVDIRQAVKLGDAFWAYVTLNVFCGMIWVPFIHLAPNLIENRYGLPEEAAATQASWLLAGPIVLYPLTGFLVDTIKRRSIITDALCFTSILTFMGYVWLALPPASTKTPIPAIISYALGHGMSPLLLVVIVPRIVPSKYVSTALGVHKSLEQAGSTLFQTIAGLLLDSQSDRHKIGPRAAQYLVNAFVILNVAQFLNIIVLEYFQRRNPLARCHHHHHNQPHSYTAPHHTEEVSDSEHHDQSPRPSPTTQIHERQSSIGSTSETQPLLGGDMLLQMLSNRSSLEGLRVSQNEIKRGRIMMVLCALLIASAWILFLGTAWFKLGQHK